MECVDQRHLNVLLRSDDRYPFVIGPSGVFDVAPCLWVVDVERG